jgi:hypothetical protein
MGTDYRSSEAGSYKYDEEEHEEQHLCVHNCWHPEDWVPPHTSSKSRQGAERASTQVVASGHTSLQRWALEPPRVTWS